MSRKGEINIIFLNKNEEGHKVAAVTECLENSYLNKNM